MLCQLMCHDITEIIQYECKYIYIESCQEMLFIVYFYRLVPSILWTDFQLKIQAAELYTE